MLMIKCYKKGAETDMLHKVWIFYVIFKSSLMQKKKRLKNKKKWTVFVSAC